MARLCSIQLRRSVILINIDVIQKLDMLAAGRHAMADRIGCGPCSYTCTSPRGTTDGPAWIIWWEVWEDIMGRLKMDFDAWQGIELAVPGCLQNCGKSMEVDLPWISHYILCISNPLSGHTRRHAADRTAMPWETCPRKNFRSLLAGIGCNWAKVNARALISKMYDS